MKFEHMKTQKYGVKTFYCSHCDKKFGLSLTRFYEISRHKNYGVKTFDCSSFEDMKTQKVWCQNFWLLSLWWEIHPFLTYFSEIWRHKNTKSMVSNLLIALIVIRNSAFLWHDFMKFQDTKIMVSKLLITLHLKIWRHKKYGVKTFYCSSFEDMKTQKVWCQNWSWSFWILKKVIKKITFYHNSLGQGPSLRSRGLL